MDNNKRAQIIGGIILSLAGVAGSITLDESRYSVISLVGVMFLLIALQSKKQR